MTFNSIEFLIFYPIVALLYFILPHRARWVMLLIASYYFYAYYQAELLPLIVGTTLVSWLAANIIHRTESRAARRLWLGITLAVCLGVLFFYKYFNFLAGSVVSLVELFGGTPSPVALDLILPVGISFYTFQTLSYVIDVYRGDIEPERNPFFYALFVSFFPQLVAGPIERPDNLIPQLKEEHRPCHSDLVKGGAHMLVGFFKKVCVADLVAVYVSSVYEDAAAATAPTLIISTLLFAVQIYCDFSGYTDIAVGCARIMGIRLMRNFDHPYTSTTVKEFWSRWHISLSTWFRDYLYIPLGGNRCSPLRHLLNLFLVFLVSGLWHGAAWTFVVWGALHGLYQVVGSLTVKPRNRLLERLGLSPDTPAVVWVRRVLTFSLVAFSWIFFRAGSMGDALTLISALARPESLGSALSRMGLGAAELALTVTSLSVLILIDRLVVQDPLPTGGGGSRASRQSLPDRSDILTSDGGFIYLLLVIMLAWLLLLSGDGESSFIYFQF